MTTQTLANSRQEEASIDDPLGRETVSLTCQHNERTPPTSAGRHRKLESSTCEQYRRRQDELSTLKCLPRFIATGDEASC